MRSVTRPIQKRDYRDPRSGLGVVLSGVGATAATDFVLHECGCRRYRDWNHRGIVSPYWRLHYNFGPGNRLIFEGRSFPLDAGAALLTPAGTMFDTDGPRTPLHTWIHFSPSREFHLALQSPLRVEMTPALRALYAELESRFSHDEPDAEEKLPLYHLCQAILHGVLSRLDRRHFQTFPAPLQELLARLQNHLADDLTNVQLARSVGMSLSRFVPWFRSHIGESPARYIQKTRIHHAAELLSLTEQSIDEIATQTGFTNRHHFTRVFTARLGRSPAAYRRRQQRSE